jgi:hypothetical protein
MRHLRGESPALRLRLRHHLCRRRIRDARLWLVFSGAQEAAVNESELARRAYALPAMFADRLDPADLSSVQGYAEAGEWGEEIDLLLACLTAASQLVTSAERQELLTLLEAMGLPAAPAEGLNGGNR